MDCETEHGEDASTDREDVKTGKQRNSTTAQGARKSKKALKVKDKARTDLTRTNVNGELVWLASSDS